MGSFEKQHVHHRGNGELKVNVRTEISTVPPGIFKEVMKKAPKIFSIIIIGFVYSFTTFSKPTVNNFFAKKEISFLLNKSFTAILYLYLV